MSEGAACGEGRDPRQGGLRWDRPPPSAFGSSAASTASETAVRGLLAPRRQAALPHGWVRRRRGAACAAGADRGDARREDAGLAAASLRDRRRPVARAAILIALRPLGLLDPGVTAGAQRDARAIVVAALRTRCALTGLFRSRSAASGTRQVIASAEGVRANGDVDRYRNGRRDSTEAITEVRTIDPNASVRSAIYARAQPGVTRLRLRPHRSGDTLSRRPASAPTRANA